jgi:hypothetical protein
MSLRSITVPALVIFWLPFSTVKRVPAGTPVLVLSGNPHALGRGAQLARRESGEPFVAEPVVVRREADGETEADGEEETDGDTGGDVVPDDEYSDVDGAG